VGDLPPVGEATILQDKLNAYRRKTCRRVRGLANGATRDRLGFVLDGGNTFGLRSVPVESTASGSCLPGVVARCRRWCSRGICQGRCRCSTAGSRMNLMRNSWLSLADVRRLSSLTWRSDVILGKAGRTCLQNFVQQQRRVVPIARQLLLAGVLS